MRPSIIFFDEIDGLAPVRSSRQDQIHSSIVSTLLALMDGLDNRGEIVVIGATNRIDSIDPALRRPGRFDREFIFPLPDKKVRCYPQHNGGHWGAVERGVIAVLFKKKPPQKNYSFHRLATKLRYNCKNFGCVCRLDGTSYQSTQKHGNQG